MGVLPRVVVVNLVLTKKAEAAQSHSATTLRDCAIIVSLQWVRCNVYPCSLRSFERRISDLFDSYTAIKKFSTKSEGYWKKASPFLNRLKELFDIPASTTYRTLCEKTWNVKMTEDDFAFYENQKKTPPVGYCSSAVDRDWERSMKRKEKRNNRTRNEHYDNLDGVVSPLIDSDDNDSNMMIDSDQNDDLPYKYRHIRHGLCSVRPEVYEVIKILQSKYHLSPNQAEGAIITVSNKLFG